MSRPQKHVDFNFSEAGEELRKLLLQIARVSVNRKKNGIVYNGPEIESSTILGTSFNIKETFSKDSITYNDERGRDKIDLFIMKVFQLGYSVGYEKAYYDYSPFMAMVNSMLKANKEKQEQNDSEN